jgi:hypothetical protein
MQAHFLRTALLLSPSRLLVPRSSFHSALIGLSESSKAVLMRKMSTSTDENTRNETTPPDSKEDDDKKMITILGFGSLLSEKSCRVTFPNLHNFRLGRVRDYRRVFAHPASIFFQREIAHRPLDDDTLQMSSLSVEYDAGNVGFVVSVFEVPNDNDMMTPDEGNTGGMIPSREFLEREEEFDIVQVPYQELTVASTGALSEPTSSTTTTISSSIRLGIICTRSTDQAYVDRWGQDRFDRHYRQFGVETIWGYGPDSGLRPCAVYLRHCYLAAKSLGRLCLDSFLDETFLVDRVTTVRDYLEQHPEVLETVPPQDLIGRYSG